MYEEVEEGGESFKRWKVEKVEEAVNGGGRQGWRV